MTRTYLAVLLGLLSLNASALGRLADITVLDRDSGRTLETYYYRGDYWVAGSAGGRYAISIRNRLHERLLAVAAVDGVNVVSGETAAWGQTGYVFGPGQAYDITGWRKSNADVAAFEFTATPNSYAERTGRPANVGVIGVALFRERNQPPVAIAVPEAPTPFPDAARQERDANAGSAGPIAERRAAADAASASLGRSAPAPQAKLGTGHGERELSYAEHTEFARVHNSPDEIIRIRYDSPANLLAMGVIRRPVHVAAVPNPFPDSPGSQFVPDPPSERGGGLR